MSSSAGRLLTPAFAVHSNWQSSVGMNTRLLLVQDKCGDTPFLRDTDDAQQAPPGRTYWEGSSSLKLY